MRKMKDSGIEWIGEIPTEWDTTRIKYLFDYRNEKNFKPLGEVNLISLYTDLGVVQHSDLESTTGNKASNADGYKLVYEDDIVVNIILCWMGAIGRSAYSGVTSPAYDVYAPQKGTNSKYYHYLFRTKGFSGDCYKYGRGIMAMRWRTYSDQFRAIRVLAPSSDEQERIVEFLDRQCAEVDAVIAKTKETIEEYKKLKQSIIARAVTRGIRGQRVMKDSGVDWIGEIPIEWTIGKVGRFFDIQLGKMLQPNRETDDDTIEHYLCAANVGGNCFKLFPIKEMWFKPNEKSAYEVVNGDLLVVEGGDIASCDIVKDCNSALYIQNALHRVRAKDKLDVRFLKYWLWFVKNVGYIELICNKATIAHFSKEKFVALPYVVATNEDREIADYLDEKCGSVDALIAKKSALLEEMEAYKKSVIYEYVTGKKEV